MNTDDIAKAMHDHEGMMWLSQRKWRELMQENTRLRDQVTMLEAQLKLAFAQGHKQVMKARGRIIK